MSRSDQTGPVSIRNRCDRASPKGQSSPLAVRAGRLAFAQRPLVAPDVVAYEQQLNLSAETLDRHRVPTSLHPRGLALPTVSRANCL